MNPQGKILFSTLILFLSPILLFAQKAKTIAIVTPRLAEFRIPIDRQSGPTWNWNRAETPDNEGEYTWQVAVPAAERRYSFGFYLYKLPGSKPAHGNLQDLLKAGQASVFREDAQGTGTLVQNAAIQVSAEGSWITIRISDGQLIHKIFGSHPESATINTRAIDAGFEVVKIEYRD